MTIDLELKLTKFILASPERVFDAWLDPAVMTRFLHGHPDHSVTSAETDPRLGGNYRVVMNNGEKDIPHWGEYRRLERATCLEFTWNSPHATPDSIVTLHFVASGEGTELTLIHDRFPTEAARDGHAGGWGCILNQLAQVLGRS